jgi:hypothetical protein
VTDERPDRTPEPEPEPEPVLQVPTVEETAEPTLVEVRRTPNYWNFMLLFAVLAAIAITIITFSLPYDAETATYSRGTVYGFALLISVAFGLALGAVIALIAERVSRRSIRLVEAEKITGKLKDPGSGAGAGSGSAR